MTIKQFRNIIMIIFILALVEIIVGTFYYFVFFSPKKQIEVMKSQEQSFLSEKQIEQDRLFRESELHEKTRMEEIRLEVKKVDLELERIQRWEGMGEEFDKLRQKEEDKKGKEADLASCMKVVVENYHNQWNLLCEKQLLPSSCLLSRESSEKINQDYEVGKAECDNFFKL